MKCSGSNIVVLVGGGGSGGGVRVNRQEGEIVGWLVAQAHRE